MQTRHMRISRFVLTIIVVVAAILAVKFMLTYEAVGKGDSDGINPQGSENKSNSNNKTGYGTNETLNLLLLGLDDNETRADVIMMINYSPQKQKMNVLSIPRDTKVVLNGRNEKINALYGIGMESLMINAVEKITKIKVDYYLTLNFKGFREIVDKLDGVIIDVPIDMKYDDPVQNLHIDIKKGEQLLDGEKAEQFVRYRKGNHKGEGYDNADIGRISMQHMFIKEFIAQKLKLKYISKAYEIFLILRKSIDTNIKPGDISMYAGDIMRMEENGIYVFTAQGESIEIGGIWYYICDIYNTRDIVEKEFYP
jgi:polyisoprenyl-teichoic acid--peptidoglycan teichoic acid transferase